MQPAPPRDRSWLGWAAVYFSLVFGAGFALGLVRVPLLVPRLGERRAELVEAPFMLLAIAMAARWIARRHLGPDRDLLACGLLAAGWVLAADVLVGLGLRGMSITQVFLARDPVSGSVYFALVAFFAAAPRLARAHDGRKRVRPAERRPA